MITTHQFPAAFGLPNISPFGLKVDLFFKMIGVDHQSVNGDPRKAPKGKLPYIEMDGRTIADSEFIVQDFIDRKKCTLDDAFSIEDKAVAHAMCRMLEERYYWTMIYSRWVDEDTWPAFKKELFPQILPPIVRLFVPSLIRKQVIKDLHSHGIGRHSKQEIYQLAETDLEALDTWLAGKKYCLGDQISSYDATVLAFTANTLAFKLPTPLQAMASKLSNIVDYNQRLSEEFL